MASAEEMEDDILTVVLQMLREECQKDNIVIADQTYATALRTLLKILRNVVDHPSDEKYRRLRVANATFSSRVWRFEAMQQLMLAVGWVQVDDAIVLTDSAGVPGVVRELEAEINKLPIPKSAAKPQSRDQPEPKETEKERQLSAARRSLLEQQKREKEDRRKIVEQINADREHNRSREVRDARARQVRFGGNVKRFEDIGVDLNRGGG